jgi:hypothetical protein
MSHRILARRAGLSLRTVQRGLSGEGAVRSDSLLAMAEALGARVGVVRAKPTAAMREEQAGAKAEEIVRVTQGSSALEGLAVGEGARKLVRQKIKAKLLAGSGLRLWG